MSNNDDKLDNQIKEFKKKHVKLDTPHHPHIQNDGGHFGTDPKSLEPEKDFQSKFKTAMLSTGGVLAAGAIGLVGFAAYRYRVAHPSQYIVRTGLFIDKVAVDKKAFQLPFQTAKTISVQPSNYTFHLQAMSQEKMEFILPGVYTIGPKDEPEALQTYATLLSNTTDEELTNIIKGIIEGETRVLTASLSLEEIFKGRDAFRDHVTERVNKELGKSLISIC